jgi:hypothetical protein
LRAVRNSPVRFLHDHAVVEEAIASSEEVARATSSACVAGVSPLLSWLLTVVRALAVCLVLRSSRAISKPRQYAPPHLRHWSGHVATGW